MSENEEVFTTRMRKATRKIHSISDALVNTKFALALRDEQVWGGGLLVFYHIFAFLEDAKERLNMPELNKLFCNEALYRKKAFEDDLTHYLGENWQSIPRHRTVNSYLYHLQNLERSYPRLLLAYVYHLYLGLLSGGQILAKKRRMFGQDNAKPNTYRDKVTDFTGTDISQLKKDFKQAMNEIAETMYDIDKTEIIGQGSTVFVFNNLIVKSIRGQNEVLVSLLYKASAVAFVVVGVVLAYKWYK